MVDLTQARLAGLAVHKVGNKLRDEGVVTSTELFEPDEILQGILEDYFLKPIKSEYFWQFRNETETNVMRR